MEYGWPCTKTMFHDTSEFSRDSKQERSCFTSASVISDVLVIICFRNADYRLVTTVK
jgi:hypothetical protein